MFFSKKPNFILYVERASIGLYPKGSGAEMVALPEDTCKYLEVIDPKKLSDLLIEFARKNGLRGKRVLIVLSRDIIFQKAAGLTKGADTAGLTAEFEHKLPFNPSDQRAVSISQKDKLFLFGANKAFYELLVSALQAMGVKVTGVTPAVAYGVTDAAKMTPAKFAQIRNAHNLTRAVDFLRHV